VASGGGGRIWNKADLVEPGDDLGVGHELIPHKSPRLHADRLEPPAVEGPFDSVGGEEEQRCRMAGGASSQGAASPSRATATMHRRPAMDSS